MIDMYIPSYNRCDNIKTLYTLPKEIQKKVTIVVQERDAENYMRKGHSVMVLPDRIRTISPTRQYIMENARRYFVMMDDDLAFFKRVKSGKRKGLLTPLKDKDYFDMFTLIEKWLKSGIAHAGISIRLNNNNLTPPYVEATRMLHFLAYDKKIVMGNKCRFDRVPIRQDFDMTLQLLKLGYPNRISVNYAINQASNKEGGLKNFRTKEMMEESAFELAKLHPGIVTPVIKNTKAWDGESFDVRIAWKKALKLAQEENV